MTSTSLNTKFLGSLFRWGVLGATLLFLLKTLIQNWQGVSNLQLQGQAWIYGLLALGVAITAQLWSALVWSWILDTLKQPMPKRWAMVVFLKNSPAKYIPGSVWHLYGRIQAARKQGMALELATMSVLLEPLFVIAGALGVAMLGNSYPMLKVLILSAILLVVHPRILNFFWGWINQLRGKSANAIAMQHYPLPVLLGATTFIALRGLTFVLVSLAFAPLNWDIFRPMIGGFSFAWLMSLVIPAPGGLGVFETAAVTVLDELLTPGLLLGIVAVYRLMIVLAEVAGLALAYLVSEGEEVVN
jgi:glycosyltransferase 2 family protein